MLFNSYEYWVFFPVVVALYFAIPVKCRNVWLLVASCYFYMCWNPRYIILMFSIIMVTYVVGLILGRADKKKQKVTVLTIGIVMCLGTLFFFKYSNFAIDSITSIANALGSTGTIKGLDIVLPVGISFYIFQGIGYMIDVYRDSAKCEKNFILYALFISFFPQLVAGPIERSDNIIKQFKQKATFNYGEGKKGLLLIAWGMLLKIVIADRLAIVVDLVFSDPLSYSGLQLMVAAIFFGVQIYCDFGGYSYIAIGTARIMGISLMHNFEQPYLSTSVSEFWRRWHISLTSWFRDYLYIPLGGNKKGTIRKYFNLLIVFLISGLWHGAGWNYIFWGGLNGLYQVIGRVTYKFRNMIKENVGINAKNRLFRLGQCVFTFLLVDFAWIFFRAESMDIACRYIGRMFTHFDLSALFDGSFYLMGLNKWEFLFAVLLIVALFFMEYLLRYKELASMFYNKTKFVGRYRWVFYSMYILLMVIELCRNFGADASQFVYFQF